MTTQIPTLFELRRVRFLLGLVAFGLFISGVTIWPALPELRWLAGLSLVRAAPALHDWLQRVISALESNQASHPFLFYGGDWLAFAHVMLAVLFVGAMRDPVRNLWVIQFGLICCACVIPFALVCGTLRQIPWWWRLIDCAFAPAAGIPLWYAYRAVARSQA